jgi:hypothetical protein
LQKVTTFAAVNSLHAVFVAFPLVIPSRLRRITTTLGSAVQVSDDRWEFGLTLPTIEAMKSVLETARAAQSQNEGAGTKAFF